MSSEQWLSTKEFAAKYATIPETIKYWRNTGKIRFVKRGARYFHLDPGNFESLAATTAPFEVREIDRIPLIRGLEVAKILDVSRRRIRQLAEQGKVGCRVIGHNRRYSIADVRKLLAYRALRAEQENGDPRKVHVTPEKIQEAVIHWAIQRLQRGEKCERNIVH